MHPGSQPARLSQGPLQQLRLGMRWAIMVRKPGVLTQWPSLRSPHFARYLEPEAVS